MLAVPRNPGATLPEGGSALFALTQWEPASLSALLSYFFKDEKLTHLERFENFRGAFDADAIVSTCGVSADALLATATNDPTPDAARKMESGTAR